MVFADTTAGIDKTVIGANTNLGWGQQNSIK
jgi:hypothetical protein